MSPGLVVKSTPPVLRVWRHRTLLGKNGEVHKIKGRLAPSSGMFTNLFPGSTYYIGEQMVNRMSKPFCFITEYWEEI